MSENMNPVDPSRLRATYPCIVRITALESAIGSGNTGTTVRYRWTRQQTLVGIQLGTKGTYTLERQVGLELAWENEHGGLYSASGTHEANLNGWNDQRWTPIEVPVNVGDWHLFTVTNRSAFTVTPILTFHVV